MIRPTITLLYRGSAEGLASIVRLGTPYNFKLCPSCLLIGSSGVFLLLQSFLVGYSAQRVRQLSLTLFSMLYQSLFFFNKFAYFCLNT